MAKTCGAVLVTGVIGSDCHAVGNAIIERFFTESGFKLVNLGVMVSQEEFVAAAVETRAAAILVSSLYGHGEMDCRGLREKCTEAGIGGILLYIGGNLALGVQDFKEVERRFTLMGFDRVFPADAELGGALRVLKRDLKKKGLI